MNRIAAARTRITRAEGLPATLAAAYDVFQDILVVLRRHEERAGTEFPAFVLAACEAANGRDWIGEATSLLPLAARPRPVAGASDGLEGYPPVRVAGEVASLSHALAGVLSKTAAGARHPEDRSCCQQAAGYAARICALLGGAPQP